MRRRTRELVLSPPSFADEQRRRHLVAYLRGYVRGLTGAPVDQPTRVQYAIELFRGRPCIVIRVSIR